MLCTPETFGWLHLGDGYTGYLAQKGDILWMARWSSIGGPWLLLALDLHDGRIRLRRQLSVDAPRLCNQGFDSGSGLALEHVRGRVEHHTLERRAWTRPGHLLHAANGLVLLLHRHRVVLVDARDGQLVRRLPGSYSSPPRARVHEKGIVIQRQEDSHLFRLSGPSERLPPVFTDGEHWLEAAFDGTSSHIRGDLQMDLQGRVIDLVTDGTEWLAAVEEEDGVVVRSSLDAERWPLTEPHLYRTPGGLVAGSMEGTIWQDDQVHHTSHRSLAAFDWRGKPGIWDGRRLLRLPADDRVTLDRLTLDPLRVRMRQGTVVRSSGNGTIVEADDTTWSLPDAAFPTGRTVLVTLVEDPVGQRAEQAATDTAIWRLDPVLPLPPYEFPENEELSWLPDDYVVEPDDRELLQSSPWSSLGWRDLATESAPHPAMTVLAARARERLFLLRDGSLARYSPDDGLHFFACCVRDGLQALANSRPAVTPFRRPSSTPTPLFEQVLRELQTA